MFNPSHLNTFTELLQTSDLLLPFSLVAAAIGLAGLAIIILYGKGKV